MDLGEIIGSGLIALALGIALGIGFKFATGDGKTKTTRDVSLGMLFTFAGWVFGMFLPIREHKAWGADLVGLVSGFILLHLYWAAIREKTNLTKGMDAESPHNSACERDLPDNI